ncbi:hypothetical protein N2152v2_002347 [Parachlorella kessleri]
MPLTPAIDICTLWLGPSPNVTLLMVADPGDYSGTGEDKFFSSLLGEKNTVGLTDSMCAKLSSGTLLGQPVALAVSGIGDIASSICATSLLDRCGSRIKEILFFGTSGWTPQPGGVLNADDCSTANPNPEIVRIGDLCVTPFSLDADCRKASWEQVAAGYPDACTLPQEFVPPDATFLFGQCLFPATAPESLTLAQELTGIARAVAVAGAYPTQSADVAQYQEGFWATMSNGTGVSYDSAGDSQPTIWGMETCVEADSQFFYSGVPYDMQQRNTVAQVINEGLGTNVTAKDVIVVSAMEATGVAYAVDRYQKFSGRDLPFVVVRGASNYLHTPVEKLPNGTWVPSAAAAGTPEILAGYAHAISVGSRALLELFSSRCKEAGGSETLCTVPALQT